MLPTRCSHFIWIHVNDLQFVSFVSITSVMNQFVSWRRFRKIPIYSYRTHIGVQHSDPQCYSSWVSFLSLPTEFLIIVPFDRHDHDSNIGEEYKLWGSSVCRFLHLSATSSLFGSYILLSTMLPNSVTCQPPFGLCNSENEVRFQLVRWRVYKRNWNS